MKVFKNGHIRLTAEDIDAYGRLRVIDPLIEDVARRIERNNAAAEVRAFRALTEEEREELFGAPKAG